MLIGIFEINSDILSFVAENIQAGLMSICSFIRIFVNRMTNEEFIKQHRHDNVRALALRKAEVGVDIKWCLQQIEGWQKACEKLPQWAEVDGLWYPPVLSMEQCSSEYSAEYKKSVVSRLLPEASDRLCFADLTGGYGIDFSYMASLFAESCYVERNAELCRVAEHNFKVLSLAGAKVVCADSTEYLRSASASYSVLYLDPARRDGVGRKTVVIGDCTPDISAILDALLRTSRYVIIKLSPMLDISAAMVVLKRVREIHVVSVKGECKELLFVLDAKFEGMPTYHAVNLASADDPFICSHEQKSDVALSVAGQSVVLGQGMYLFEPNASVLKAGIQDVLCQHYGVAKLHPMSNLFISKEPVEGFPGRAFKVVEFCGFGKKELRSMLGETKRANIAIRNFPSTVADLRKKLRLAEGGDVYLFATTLADGSHVLVRCAK